MKGLGPNRAGALSIAGRHQSAITAGTVNAKGSGVSNAGALVPSVGACSPPLRLVAP